MKGIVLTVFDGNISFLSVFRNRQRQSTQNQMQTYFSPSVLVFYQRVKIEKILHSMYISVYERETLLFFLMNLLTGPALALRSSQFEKKHISQLTGNRTRNMSRTLSGIGEFHFVMRPLRTCNDYRNALFLEN